MDFVGSRQAAVQVPPGSVHENTLMTHKNRSQITLSASISLHFFHHLKMSGSVKTGYNGSSLSLLSSNYLFLLLPTRSKHWIFPTAFYSPAKFIWLTIQQNLVRFQIEVLRFILKQLNILALIGFLVKAEIWHWIRKQVSLTSASHVWSSASVVRRPHGSWACLVWRRGDWGGISSVHKNTSK